METLHPSNEQRPMMIWHVGYNGCVKTGPETVSIGFEALLKECSPRTQTKLSR